MNTSTIKEYEQALIEWIDTLTLNGKSGRRAVFVERSLKRRYKLTVQKAVRMSPSQIPSNWFKGLDAFKLLTLWHLTNNISRKFKTEIPEQFKFRKLLAEL
jgi:hypothetical protein